MSRRRAPVAPPAPERARLIADFYAAQSRPLRARVAYNTGRPPDAIEDACHTAWAILLRRPDISLDVRGLAWLTIVAVHEVRHQRSDELPMGALTLGAGGVGELPEPAATTEVSVDELAAAHLEHAERVADLAAVKPAERTALYLQALGYRYREIAQLSGAGLVNVAWRRCLSVDDMSPSGGRIGARLSRDGVCVAAHSDCRVERHDVRLERLGGGAGP